MEECNKSKEAILKEVHAVRAQHSKTSNLNENGGIKQLSNIEMQSNLTGRKCLMVLNQIRGGSTKSLHLF